MTDPRIAIHEALARKALHEAHNETWQQPDPAKVLEAVLHQLVADRLRRGEMG